MVEMRVPARLTLIPPFERAATANVWRLAIWMTPAIVGARRARTGVDGAAGAAAATPTPEAGLEAEVG
jgi:hypothetical protein